MWRGVCFDALNAGPSHPLFGTGALVFRIQAIAFFLGAQIRRVALVCAILRLVTTAN